MKARTLIIAAIAVFLPAVLVYAEGDPKAKAAQEPVVVNGDVVEYSAENKNVTASGNVSIEYKDTRLTCDKLTVNTETKDGEIEGNLRIEDKKGVIEGEKASYNFQNKAGLIDNAAFRSDPYFGRAERVKKINDREFIAYRGYLSTCGYDTPHYRIKSRRINFFPGDKIQTRDDAMYMGRIPVMCLPQYNHSLKDPMMHVQLTPGQRKDWGPYMLSAWRYNLNDNASGRVYFDYRNKLGIAEGFGLNYDTKEFGKGDFKYYYTSEKDDNLANSGSNKFQRYLIRWRHKWNIDSRTNFTSEYYRISDAKRKKLGADHNFLRDYFYREYEKDSEPLSYGLFHHSFNYSSLDIMMQKRVNHWYTAQDQKLPEIIYSMPSLQLGSSPFYLEDKSSYVNYNHKNTAPQADTSYSKFDTTNKLSLPMRVSIISLTPFLSGEQTYFNKSTYGATNQTILSAGSDFSSKFYRLFNFNTNFLKLDINGLRHIVTPTLGYSYINTSTMPASKFRFGGGASVGSQTVTMELSNKLQTKRKNQSVVLADFKINTSYNIKPKNPANGKTGSSFQDIIFDLDLWPYPWMSIVADATYAHSGLRSSPNYNTFSNANLDINFNLGKDRSIGIGQRYQRKAGKELTFDTHWRINPKWKFGVYERYQFADITGYRKGLREQEYSLIRDLHCWSVELTYNIEKESGNTIWMIFRLKAFPENEFGFNQTYNQPKPGSQNN